jgi:hypothetical protein
VLHTLEVPQIDSDSDRREDCHPSSGLRDQRGPGAPSGSIVDAHRRGEGVDRRADVHPVPRERKRRRLDG